MLQIERQSTATETNAFGGRLKDLPYDGGSICHTGIIARCQCIYARKESHGKSSKTREEFEEMDTFDESHTFLYQRNSRMHVQFLLRNPLSVTGKMTVAGMRKPPDRIKDRQEVCARVRSSVRKKSTHQESEGAERLFREGGGEEKIFGIPQRPTITV
ncbi:10802_t:CDS:2 [Acaulospora colombiana]|uniref:10802_t:CDS:1 n=1 Tax=Acaulospora colombiana TaxID=27376 RepID=A0ACA9KT16_9GLOM|nr:10802_t:CDS:2 [Acaulospora colombiana]